MVRPARPEDAPRLDDVLADAFFDDPISVHLVPDTSRRRDRLRLGMGHVLRTYIASNGAWTTDDLDGVALWAKPGDPRPSALQQLKDLPTFVRSFGRHLPRAMRAFGTAEGVPAFLVTSNPANVPFYEKLGFAVDDEYEVGPVHVWAMLRPPGAAGP